MSSVRMSKRKRRESKLTEKLNKTNEKVRKRSKPVLNNLDSLDNSMRDKSTVDGRTLSKHSPELLIDIHDHDIRAREVSKEIQIYKSQNVPRESFYDMEDLNKKERSKSIMSKPAIDREQIFDQIDKCFKSQKHIDNSFTSKDMEIIHQEMMRDEVSAPLRQTKDNKEEGGHVDFMKFDDDDELKNLYLQLQKSIIGYNEEQKEELYKDIAKNINTYSVLEEQKQEEP